MEVRPHATGNNGAKLGIAMGNTGESDEGQQSPFSWTGCLT